MARINKKADILAAAERIFSHKGSAATIGEIGVAAGVTDSVIYHYFKNKDDLMFSVLSERLGLELESVGEHLEAIRDPVSQLSKLIWMQLRYHDNHPDYAALQLFECRSNRKFRGHEAHRLTMQWAAFFTQVLTEGVTAGRFSRGLNIPVARDAVLGMLDMQNIFCLAARETDNNLMDHERILALVLAMLTPESSEPAGDRRDVIMGAAEKVISDRGFNRAKIQDIASLAGVSEGAIYEVFSNKDDLLFSSMEKRFDSHIDSLEEAFVMTSPIRKLRRFIKLHFMLYCQGPEFLKIFLTDGIFNKKFYVSKAFDRFMIYLKEMDVILELGKAEGAVRADLDNRLFRNLFLGAFCHMSLRWQFSEAHKPTNMIQEINAAVDLMVRAVQ